MTIVLKNNRKEREKQGHLSELLQSSKLTGLTLWGVSDADSWIPYSFNRLDWPLLFDSNYEPKPAAEGFLKALKTTASESTSLTTTEKPTSSTSQPSDSSGFLFLSLLIGILAIVSFRRSKGIS